MERSLEDSFLRGLMGKDTPCPKVGSQNGQGCSLEPTKTILRTKLQSNGRRLVVITPGKLGIPEAAQVWIDEPREDTAVVVLDDCPDKKKS